MPTLDLSFLNDTSRSHFIPTVKQSIYQKTPLFNALDSKGKVQPATGTSLIWDTIAEKSANVVWYSGYDVFANQPNRLTRQASLSPANLSVPMAISGEEERKNSGSMEKLVDMVLAKQVAGGAFSDDDYAKLDEKKKSAITILAQTERVPRHFFSVRRDFAPTLVDRLEKILLSMHENEQGRRILKNTDDTTKFDLLPEGEAAMRRRLAEIFNSAGKN